MSSFCSSQQGLLSFARSLVFAVIAVVLFAAGSSQAGTILPGQYFLLDHPDGTISPPPYGLRLDYLGITLSTELNGASTVLSWDGGTTATISGTLWNNQAAEMWSVDYTLTGVSAAPANLGFSAVAGSGTLTDASLNVIALTGLQGGTGSTFDFLADGHRLGSHPGYGGSQAAVGRGWLTGAGTNDWLVLATPVPEPGTALLFGLGLAFLSSSSSRRS
ncbi:MAG TPA: PEP-CTERM sorting domain-containing protein [Myxococcales bacterium]|nr:PEP-CTERM sorting domain-containing protein [Myxococcales bacterium]HIL79937.1 PEP-CTERM sorting domain-containing protein [Myxococcales bacterium]